MSDIRKGLETDARCITERIPMSYDHSEVKRIINRLKKFLADHGISQAELARSLGLNNSRLNQFMHGKYKGDIESIVNRAVNYIDSVERKQRAGYKPAFVDTTVAKAIGTLITQTENLSEQEGKIGLVIGDGGHGKSLCLRQFAKANQNTFYIELDDTMSSTSMFAAIAKAANIDPYGSISTITSRIINTLELRHAIILIDEASGLNVKKLNQIRQVLAVKSRCPVVLAGNCDLLKTVMQSKTRRGYESLDQFTSRLSYILNLDEISSRKGGGLYTESDVRKLYEYGGIKLTSDAVKLLKRICSTGRSGRLRTCSNIIAALHTSRVVGEKGRIDAALITAAIEQLNLPVKIWLPVASVPDQAQTQTAAAKAG